MIHIKRVLCGSLMVGLALSPAAIASSKQAVRVPEPRFDFGTAVQGKAVTHQFTLQNEGATTLRIRGMSTTASLLPGRIPAQIGPGVGITIPVQLNTSKLNGPFEGQIVIAFDDPDSAEARLIVTGRVVPPIEMRPMPAFFAATLRGEPKSVFVEIINHENDPLIIEALEHPTDRFTTRLETLEAGRRYRVHLTLNANGPGGKHQENIRVLTLGNGRAPFIIPAYTSLRERVYTFPDTVYLGRLPLAAIEAIPDILPRIAQTLMVYRLGRSDFEVKMRTDLPELDLRWERGPQGDRYQATVTLIKDKIRPGPITGSIVIQTNDAEFPTLTVPVSGAILPE